MSVEANSPIVNPTHFLGKNGAAPGYIPIEAAKALILNDLPISVMAYGAVGDETSRPVSQWFTGGARSRGYANLAALQVDYPKVTSASDEIDWAAIQKALDVASQVAGKESRRVVIPAGIYYVNKTIQLDRNVELFGEGMGSTWLVWTSALTSGPCVQVKPTPSTATSSFCAVRDLQIDATAVPVTNVTNHGIEFYNTVQSEVQRVSIKRPKAYGVLMSNGTYFCTVDNVAIDRPDDSAICLRNGITGSTDAYGDGNLTCNGNMFSNIFFYLNYGPSPGPYRRPRLIEVLPPCNGNFFNNLQVQTGTYPLDDCFIFMCGSQNKISDFFTFDGPGVTRTCVTSSGAGGKIRLTFTGFLPNLVTGDKITATGITGITNGTLYSLTGISEFVFDVTGTTYSGSSQTGRIVRGASITATASSGGGNRIQVTCAEHGLFTGQQITVAGITGGTGAQSVIRVDRNTFQLAGTTYGGSSQTGTWTIDRPTCLVQFGDVGHSDNFSGTKSIFQNFCAVMNHDASTKVYAVVFTNWANSNAIGKCYQDQGGTMLPYLQENGPSVTSNNRMADWPATTLTDTTSYLTFFEGNGIDYSPRLGAKSFGASAPTTAADMIEGQLAFALIGGILRFYCKTGGVIYELRSVATIT